MANRIRHFLNELQELKKKLPLATKPNHKADINMRIKAVMNRIMTIGTSETVFLIEFNTHCGKRGKIHYVGLIIDEIRDYLEIDLDIRGFKLNRIISTTVIEPAIIEWQK